MAGIIIGSPGFRKLGKAAIKATVKAVKQNPKTAAAVGGGLLVVAIATQVDYSALAARMEKKADDVANKLERKLDEMEDIDQAV